MKQQEFSDLIKELGCCKLCTKCKCENNSLVNFYDDYEFAINIPSIWTDWFNRLDANIMIIGQDWGPFKDMKKFHDMLDDNKTNWGDVIELEKSNTKKILEKYIKESSNGKYSLSDCFITNAIMCARQGDNYRGNNINLKRFSENCSKFLYSQIDIVKPKVIITLGYYPLYALAKIFGFNIKKTLRESIEVMPEIRINSYVIIPVYHPVAQIKKEEQFLQYDRIWKYID